MNRQREVRLCEEEDTFLLVSHSVKTLGSFRILFPVPLKHTNNSVSDHSKSSYLFTHLAVVGLSCLHEETLAVACGLWFLEQRLNLDPLHWEHAI